MLQAKAIWNYEVRGHVKQNNILSGLRQSQIQIQPSFTRMIEEATSKGNKENIHMNQETEKSDKLKTPVVSTLKLETSFTK